MQLSKNWRPWLKSNQQDAVLETAPGPRPHGLSIGVADGIRTRYDEGHNLALFLSSLSHTATVDIWRWRQDSNLQASSLQMRRSAN